MTRTHTFRVAFHFLRPCAHRLFTTAGMRGSVQKYALVDPDHESVHQCEGCPPRCPRRGRLKPAADAGPLPAEWRGRLAMGEPTLLLLRTPSSIVT